MSSAVLFEGYEDEPIKVPRIPRDYQKDLVRRAAIKLKEKNWIIVQSPTGSGKSFMMLMITDGGLRKGNTFLVLTESRKIFNQLSNEFGAVRINAKTNYFVMRPGNVYVAMSQSLANRPRIIKQFLDLGEKLILMIDEAHIGTTRKVIEVFPGKRLGFTATPAYKWAKFLPEVYNDIVCGLQVEELIDQGALSPYRHIGRKKIDAGTLEKNSSGEYSEASQEKAFSTSLVYEGLYEDLLTVQFKKAIIYVASIKQCWQVYENLTLQGYDCSIFHSQLDQSGFSEEEEMERYHNDPKCNIMVSVAALTKGYDNPWIDLVVLLRATTSLPLYLQMIGRGGRPMPHKLYFTCLDYGLNFDRFGAWDANREWDKLWLPGKEKDKEAAPVKSCPQCASYLPTSARVCKWCGYKYPESEMVYAIGELIDFNETATRLLGRYVGDLTPEELADYARNKNAPQKAIRIAMSRRQVERWQYAYAVKNEFLNDPWKGRNYLRDFGAAMDYKPNWYLTMTGAIDKQEKSARNKAIENGTDFNYECCAIKFHNHILR